MDSNNDQSRLNIPVLFKSHSSNGHNISPKEITLMEASLFKITSESIYLTCDRSNELRSELNGSVFSYR